MNRELVAWLISLKRQTSYLKLTWENVFNEQATASLFVSGCNVVSSINYYQYEKISEFTNGKNNKAYYKSYDRSGLLKRFEITYTNV